MSEAAITINGTPLTDAQSMTVRVAVSSFSLRLQDEGLGADEQGKALTAAYMARIKEILPLLLQKERGS